MGASLGTRSRFPHFSRLIFRGKLAATATMPPAQPPPLPFACRRLQASSTRNSCSIAECPSSLFPFLRPLPLTEKYAPKITASTQFHPLFSSSDGVRKSAIESSSHSRKKRASIRLSSPIASIHSCETLKESSSPKASTKMRRKPWCKLGAIRGSRKAAACYIAFHANLSKLSFRSPLLRRQYKLRASLSAASNSSHLPPRPPSSAGSPHTISCC